MKHLILLTAILLLFLNVSAQTTGYIFNVKSLKINGILAQKDVLKGKEVTLKFLANSSTATLATYMGKEMINSGALTLVMTSKQVENKDSNAGYIIDYRWNCTNFKKVNRIYDLRLRIILSSNGDKFVLDRKYGNETYQYQGAIINN